MMAFLFVFSLIIFSPCSLLGVELDKLLDYSKTDLNIVDNSIWDEFLFHESDTLKTIYEPWPRHTIDRSASGADGIRLADINSDGHLDIVTGWEESGFTKLYLHPGREEIKSTWPSVIIGLSPNVEDAICVDVNGDSNIDVVSCTEGKTKTIFFHFGPKSKWLKAKKWQRKALPASVNRMQWMYALSFPLDGKNGLDIIAAGKGNDAQIGWFEAPKNPKNVEDWQWHPISDVGWVMSIYLRDMDADNDMDILITDRYGSQQGCKWLENPGLGEKQKELWKSHHIGSKNLEVMFMTIADWDGDQQEEIIVSERTQESIRVYTRIENQWTEKTLFLPPYTGRAKSVEVGDLNMDGVMDLIISTNTYNEALDGLIWLDGRNWDQPIFHSISGKHPAKYDKVVLEDIDQDGDLDILICEENYGVDSQGLGVIWYENLSRS